MRKRLLGVLASIVIALVVLVGGLYLFNIGPFLETEASDRPSIKEINERSFDTEELTTNLKSGEFVQAQFRIQLDHTDTLEELVHRDFQVKNVVLLTLAETTADEIIGSEGMKQLEEQIQQQLNEYLETGTVEEVYTTTKVVQ